MFVFSIRYKKPECDSAARSRDSEMEDSFRDRDLTGEQNTWHELCPNLHTCTLFYTNWNYKQRKSTQVHIEKSNMKCTSILI